MMGRRLTGKMSTQRPITCLTNRLAFTSTPIDVIHLNQIGSILLAPSFRPPPHQWWTIGLDLPPSPTASFIIIIIILSPFFFSFLSLSLSLFRNGFTGHGTSAPLNIFILVLAGRDAEDCSVAPGSGDLGHPPPPPLSP